MEKIKIVFLGTGSAIPTISRNHTSIFLKYKNRNILIDCGEGTQRQIRKAKINICKITDILITHFHGDHVFGLPGFLHTISKSECKKVINIYGPKGSKKLIKEMLRVSSIKGVDIKIKEVEGKFIDNPYFKISAFSLKHDVPCNGYMIEEKNRLRIDKKKLKKLRIKNIPELGKLINKKNIKVNGKIVKWKNLTYLERGRKISFILDTKLCDNVNKLAKNSDLAIMEAVFLESKEGKELVKKYKHLTLEQSVKVAIKEKVKKLILTHISQRYDYKDKDLLKEAKKVFFASKFSNKKSKVFDIRIAKDLMVVEI